MCGGSGAVVLWSMLSVSRVRLKYVMFSKQRGHPLANYVIRFLSTRNLTLNSILLSVC
jgi:hypothetical protein